MTHQKGRTLAEWQSRSARAAGGRQRFSRGSSPRRDRLLRPPGREQRREPVSGTADSAPGPRVSVRNPGSEMGAWLKVSVFELTEQLERNVRYGRVVNVGLIVHDFAWHWHHPDGKRFFVFHGKTCCISNNVGDLLNGDMAWPRDRIEPACTDRRI